MRTFILNKTLPVLLSALCIIVLWSVTAAVTDAPLIIPSPSLVCTALFRHACTALFWKAVGATFLRSMASFLIAVVLGTAAGTLSGISFFFRQFFSLPVELIRAAPVVSVILIALFWFTSDTIPVFVSVLASFPIMTSSVTEGFMHRDAKLIEMAEIYTLTRLQKFRWITVPAVRPFFLTGAVASFGLTWKATVAGEVLCLPALGAGTLMQTAQVHLETAQVLAVTFAVVLISFTIEKLALHFVSGKKER